MFVPPLPLLLIRSEPKRYIPSNDAPGASPFPFGVARSHLPTPHTSTWRFDRPYDRNVVPSPHRLPRSLPCTRPHPPIRIGRSWWRRRIERSTWMSRGSRPSHPDPPRRREERGRVRGEERRVRRSGSTPGSNPSIHGFETENSRWTWDRERDVHLLPPPLHLKGEERGRRRDRVDKTMRWTDSSLRAGPRVDPGGEQHVDADPSHRSVCDRIRKRKGKTRKDRMRTWKKWSDAREIGWNKHVD